MAIDIDSRLDPELAEVRARFPSLGFDLRDLEGSRALMAKIAEKRQLPDDSGVRIETAIARSTHEPGDVAVRILRPDTVAGPLPALLWIHGGGYVLGTAADTDSRLAEIAERVGCAVVSVDYRLAPEHPYPAAVDDCALALAWLFDNASELGIDRRRVAIGGASAGGGLAAALALRTRDEQLPAPIFQLLVYPMLDDRNDTRSSHAIDDPTLWDRRTNLLAWKLYLGQATGGETPPYAAPARAERLAGLPPAFVAVGDLDLFLDEDIHYAQRLLQADVPTELHVYPGAIHGFDMLAAEATISRRFNADVEAALRAAFTANG